MRLRTGPVYYAAGHEIDQAVAPAHFFDDPSIDLVMFTEEPFVGSGVHIFRTPPTLGFEEATWADSA